MPVIIEIKNLQTKIPLSLPFLRTTVRKILKHEGIAEANLSIAFVSNRKIKAFNQKYLRHNYATDVLSFPSYRRARMLDGEIVISAEMAASNARKFATSLRKEIVLYLVHGILHLSGYNDHSPREIKRMRGREQKLTDFINK